MARTKEQIDYTKKRISAGLTTICENYELIQAEMATLPHQRGIAHQSLDRKTGQFVVGSKEGFTADYIDSTGQRYAIRITKR